MEEILKKVYNKENLTKEEMKKISKAIFNGDVSDINLGAFLIALKAKGETVEEITALAEVMQDLATKIPFYEMNVMDNCGTGGDKSNSFNISTTSAFVMASAGITVAKHGNRSISSKSGSADVLSELGVNIFLEPDKISKVLAKTNIAFLFAPSVHPSMKKVMTVRNALKVPTIFNLIGPLVNPVKLNSQLMGIYRGDLIEDIAHVLKNIGRKRAVVINGYGHMDEASLEGENNYALLKDNEVTLHTIKAEDVGLPSYSLNDIRGGDAKENARILKSVLKGTGKRAYIDTVIFNSGIGIYANGMTSSIKDGVNIARHLIESGAAYNKFEEFVQYQNEV